MASDYHIAFWNLENLFAPANHPDRIEWIAKRLKSQLKGWSQKLFDKKLAQLTKVIVAMNGGQGPDLLGVCEVENKFVLQELLKVIKPKLPGRTYDLVHADSERDSRGIDTAFIFDKKRLVVNRDEVFSHFVMRRTGTRDITQATFKTQAGAEFVALCNHWPSRLGSAHLSSGFRQTAGETLGYWHERIREVKGKDVAVIAMGDFNDDPHDLSITVNANATRVRSLVTRGRSARFYNLTWNYLEQLLETSGRRRTVSGTLYYKGEPNVFDQIMVSKGFITESNPLVCNESSARIEAIPDMVSTKASEGPIRFGFPKKGVVKKHVNTEGFSDHFPISVIIRER